jgi:hypothetical protein
MKLPRRKFLHLAAGAADCVADRLGANLPDAAGATNSMSGPSLTQSYFPPRAQQMNGAGRVVFRPDHDGALREASIAAPSRHPTNTYRRLVS